MPEFLDLQGRETQREETDAKKSKEYQERQEQLCYAGLSPAGWQSCAIRTRVPLTTSENLAYPFSVSQLPLVTHSW